MPRRARLLVWIPVGLVAAGAGVAAVAVFCPRHSLPLDEWLIGAWEADAEVNGPIRRFERYEFYSDGTYAYQVRAPGIEQATPEPGKARSRWDVVKKEGNMLTLRLGDKPATTVELTFDGKDAMTRTGPPPNPPVTFRRVARRN